MSAHQQHSWRVVCLAGCWMGGGILGLAVGGVIVPLAADGDVSISLTVTPDVVANPGGTVTIDWLINPEASTPDSVVYRLEDPPRTTIIESEVYAGAAGLDVTRQWTVPAVPQMPAGIYWVRVEYYADGAPAYEAVAEANFEVDPVVPLMRTTWGGIRSLFVP